MTDVNWICPPPNSAQLIPPPLRGLEGPLSPLSTFHGLWIINSQEWISMIDAFTLKWFNLLKVITFILSTFLSLFTSSF